MGARDMTEIEIGPDSDAPGPEDPDDLAPHPDRTAARRSAVLRVLRRWWPVAAVAVVGVVGWQVVADARVRATAERLREVRGVIGTTVTPSLAASPWGDGEHDALLRLGTPVGDGRVAGVEHDLESREITAVMLDSATGEVLWSTPLAEPGSPEAALPVAQALPSGCVADADPPSTLWCFTLSPEDVADDAWVLSTTLTGLDVASGEVVGRRSLDPGAGATLVGDLLVVGTVALDGATAVLDLTASDVLSGDHRWSARVGDVGSTDGTSIALETSGPYVVVGGPGRDVAVDPADGRVVAEGQQLQVGRSGTLLATEGSSGTRLLGPDGSADVAVTGTPMSVTPDDGSAPDLEVLFRADGTPRGKIAGVDATTGEDLWEHEGPRESYSPLVLLDGVLYGDDGDSLWARDAETGQDVWRTTAGGGTSTLLTDGVHLLRGELATGAVPVVAAYDLDDGRRAWSTTLPSGIRELRTESWTAGGALYGTTPDGLVVLLR